MKFPWRANRTEAAVLSDRIEIEDDRGGTLPLLCRWPKDQPLRGAIIFCHGLGGSADSYDLWSRTWAAGGYLVIHPTFPDSIYQVARENPDMGLDPTADLRLWMRDPDARAQMHKILHNPDYWRARIDIAHHVLNGLDPILHSIDHAEAEPPLAIAGHSFGAYTTQLLAGAEIDLPEGPASFREPRFRAALVLSGQGRNQQGLREGSWRGMSGPVLTVTGKRDGGAMGQDWHWKCEPFNLAPAGNKYLAVIGDADHYLGGLRQDDTVVMEQFNALALITTAFLDSHLAGARPARNWLNLVKDKVGNCEVIFRRK